MEIPKKVWLYLGHVCVALGIIGVALPIMPGAPFFILAAPCYARGSRKFFIKLVRHKQIGPPVRRWLRHGTMPWRAKMYATGGMAVGSGTSIYFFVPVLWGQLSIAAVCVCAALYILTRPTTPIA